MLLIFLSAYSIFADTNSRGSKNFIIIDDNSAIKLNFWNFGTDWNGKFYL